MTTRGAVDAGMAEAGLSQLRKELPDLPARLAGVTALMNEGLEKAHRDGRLTAVQVATLEAAASRMYPDRNWPKSQ